MSGDVKIPDERSPLEIAESLITAPYEWQSDAILAVADALLAAEQRGRKAGLEEAAGYVVKFARVGAKDRAEMQDKRMLNLFVQMEAALPAAIRSLGEQT